MHVQRVQHLRTLIERAYENSTIAAWLRARHYGFVVLGTTAAATKALERAVFKTSLQQEAVVVVGLGPTAETLAETLRDRGR